MSTTFLVTRDQVINNALRKQGWLDYTQSADATKISNMAESLQIMIKGWAARGIKVWTCEELVLTLVGGQAKYTIGPSGADLTANRPMRVIDCFLRLNPSSSSPNDTPLTRISKQEYNMLGNKSSQGVPNSYFYDAQLNGVSNTKGDFYLYNVPAASTASNYNVHIFSQRQIFDISAANDNFDFPQEWFWPLVWNLANETADENKTPPDRCARIERMAMQTMTWIEDFDREWASIYFQPDTNR